MDKESGLAILNFPVSAVDIDTMLLSGFIQANISFSESHKELNIDSGSLDVHHFYELQYKNFNILLKNGDFIRICMILDHKASNNMREAISQLLLEFENRFQNKLSIFQETGGLDSDNMSDFIVNSLNINLVFPMILAHAIPPGILRKLDNNKIQKAIINLAKEFLSAKSFFYINNLLNKVQKIVNIKPRIVLYEIYQLLEKKIIIPTTLETVASKLESLQEADHKRAAKIKPISSILISEEDEAELKQRLKTITKDSAKDFIKNLIKRGRTAEKASTYDIAYLEYNKALITAKEFNLKEDISRLSQILFNIEKRAKQVELDFSLEAGENAEKNKDYINAIYHYQKAHKILEGFLIYDSSDSRIKKLKKKISRLREEM